jgi:peptidoglycan hydrolase-like protein with peptidoglycan-binding domain
VPWTIWQYSDGGGKLDHNKANFDSRVAMKAWADGLKPPTIPKLKLSDFNAARSDIHHARTVQAHPLTVHRGEWALHDFGFGSPDLIDGHYGTATDLAVKAFQHLVSPGAKPDGILGPLEWARLAAGPKDGIHPARFIPA